MSYCRFSSDNFRCDLYCYEDCRGGWTTHVAANRVVGEIPEIPMFGTVTPEEWLAAHKAQMAFLKNADRVSIGLPFDGQQFNDPDLESFRDRVASLIAAGYNAPSHVLTAIDEEIAEENKASKSPIPTT